MMDPDLLARRRTTVFQKIQLEFTQGDVIRKKLAPGKFPTSSIGIVKLLAMLIFLCGAIVFFTSTICPGTSLWYPWLFTVASCVGAIITIIFYAIFTFGIALKFPAFFFISDIITSILIAILVIVTSVLTMQECQEPGAIYQVPGPLGICGSVFLLISGAGMYIMYRNKDDIEVAEVRVGPLPTSNPRRQRIAEDNDIEV